MEPIVSIGNEKHYVTTSRLFCGDIIQKGNEEMKPTKLKGI